METGLPVGVRNGPPGAEWSLVQVVHEKAPAYGIFNLAPPPTRHS
jgi:hypothetical protein